MQVDSNDAKPNDLIHIGWVILSAVPDPEELEAHVRAAHIAAQIVVDQFPDFRWQWQIVRKYRYPPHGTLDPLDLLECGVQEKIRNRWDYAIVVVCNELKARYRVATLGVPSSALEVGVVSSEELLDDPDLDTKLAGLALHILGHLWGLDHAHSGPMAPPEHAADIQPQPFSEEEAAQIYRRLREASDARLEEQVKRRGRLQFHWSTFWADPRGILQDVLGYAPWKLPLKMGRMTAAAAVSILFVTLGAESWEVGTHLKGWQLGMGTFVAVLAATWFIYVGQNLGQITRELGYREQVVRTRMVIFLTLMLGLFCLWGMLSVIIFAVASAFPEKIVSGWAALPSIYTVDLFRYAAFMAIIGVIAGAVGGNIEEEGEIKADLFFDEEA